MTAPGTVTIVGLGVIGGSLARALAARGWAVRGFSPDHAERELAAAVGIPARDVAEIDRPGALADASLIVVAVPIAAIAPLAARIVSAARADAIVVHTASLLAVGALGMDPRVAEHVFGTHPLAGSHMSGFAGSDPSIFGGCTVVIDERTPAAIRGRVEHMWRDAGAARVMSLDAAAHDATLAWTSHLPQLTATALASVMAGAGIDTSISGPGLRDTTRLAMSSWTLWQPILTGAPEDLSRALLALEHALHEMRVALELRDADAIAPAWERGLAWRDALSSR